MIEVLKDMAFECDGVDGEVNKMRKESYKISFDGKGILDIITSSYEVPNIGSHRDNTVSIDKNSINIDCNKCEINSSCIDEKIKEDNTLIFKKCRYLNSKEYNKGLKVGSFRDDYGKS